MIQIFSTATIKIPVLVMKPSLSFKFSRFKKENIQIFFWSYIWIIFLFTFKLDDIFL